MVFSYKPRGSRSGRIPRLGKYTDEFYQKLDEYMARLDLCKGRFIIRPLNKLIDKMAEDMATMADLTDDDLLFELSHRSLVSAWKAGCILWVLNNQTWTKSMGELVEWLVYHDLWSKMQIFADMLKDGDVSTTETSSAAVRRTCSTTCPIRSTRHSWRRCAQSLARTRRAQKPNCASGCSASSSPSPARPDCTRKPTST